MRIALIVVAIAMTFWGLGYWQGSWIQSETKAAPRRIRVELQGSLDRSTFSTICASGELMNQFRIVSKEGHVDVSSDIFEPWRD